ncbi:MAG: HipA domain-containing protein [Gammaproteobacteria bacterium]|nr:MAG: HipA domain-containing protein [Gammaproteobacteria bacterium]
MISRRTASECYVYITLPGETEFVTAGKIELSTDRRGIPTGKFVYGRKYLARDNAVPIDPLELKLNNKTYETNILQGIFGSLRDASPDYWGRTVIEKHLKQTQLGEIDYLLYSPDDRAGALGFGLNQEPPAPRRKFNQTMDLERLQALADAIIADEELPDGPESEQAQDLMAGGTSMGGARPKAVVEDEDGLWIAKLHHPEDKWNDARVEHAMLMLARECGLQAAESKVTTIGEHDAVLVKRFDRENTKAGYRRGRVLSALTLLRADDDPVKRENWSYVLLVEELRRISSQPRTDAPELFRRMCFNALISNTDDHPRNHAVVAMNTDWKLSPAYDLTPSTPISVEHRDLALECGDMGRYANAENLLSQSARFFLEPDEAKRTIEEMEENVISKWYDTALREGVTEKDCERIASAFAYPGFRLEAAA